MKLTALIFLLLIKVTAPASLVTLAWDVPADTNGIAGYRFQDAQTGAILGSVGGAATSNSPVICNYGERVVMVSYADDGGISDPSNVITNTVLPKSGNLRKK